MENKVQKSGNMKLYVWTVVFSLFWIFLAILTPAMRELDYGWNHLIVNLPEKLYRFTLTEGPPNYGFLFGKYINKQAGDMITVTAIDDYTLEKYGWPIKRKYYGDVIKELKRLGVKAVGVDVLLFEQDKDNKGSDQHYVDEVARAGNVVNLVGVEQYTWDLKRPLPGLEKASALIAYPNVDLTKDPDGQVRQYYPFYKPRDSKTPGEPEEYLTYRRAGLTKVRCWDTCMAATLPSLGIAPYAVSLSTSLTDLEKDYKEYRMLNYRYITWRRAHPARNKDPKVVVMSSFRHISVRDILDGSLADEEKEALKGGITFLGSTATGAFDHVPSPFLNQLPGVEVHATFLDNLMAGDFREPVKEHHAALLILLLPWIPVFLRKYSLKMMVSVSLGVLAALFVADVVLLAENIVLQFVSVASSLFLPFAYITVDKGLAEGREKKWIKNTFGQYLSPKVVEIITRDPSKLSLGGEKRDMTAFFLDIAGFTTMSEKLTPEQLTQMLNEYLSGLTDTILKNDGVVDKYIGDCIMAFWNAPLDQKDHRRLACLAAVDCQTEMTRLNQTLTQFTIKPSCRIGLNSGPMVVGNMGSRTRLSYTVMGDSVNLASRLEGANKYFHSRIMASEYTYAEAKDAVEARTLGQIRVVGKAIPVKVYELLARKGGMDEKTAKLAAVYNDGLDHFYKGAYEKANKAFKAALEVEPKDGPSAFYLELAEKYAVSVPKDWDGTFNLTSK